MVRMKHVMTPRKRKIQDLQEQVTALEKRLAEAQATIRILAAPWKKPAAASDTPKVELLRQYIPGPEKRIANRERFRQTILVMPYPIMIWRDDGKVIMVNTAWMEITGYTLEDIPTIAEWMQKAYAERGPQRQQPLVHEKGSSPSEVMKWGEFKIITRSGKRRIWDFSTASLGVDEKGRRLVMTMAVDVTYRRQVEKAAQASETKYRSLAKTAFEGIWVVDPGGHTTWVNQRMAEMLKYDSPDDLNDHAVFDFIHPEDFEQVKAQFRTGSSQKDTEWYEVRLQCRDGSIRWASVKVANLLDEWAKPLGRMALFLDITERRRLEQALRESEGRLQALADSLPRLEKMARVIGIFFKKYGNRSLPGT